MSNSERSESPTDQGSGSQPGVDKPVPSDSAREKAKDMMKAYEDRPTAVLPGSNRTVTGTAVNEWLDDDGQPIYGKEDSAGDS